MEDGRPLDRLGLHMESNERLAPSSKAGRVFHRRRRIVRCSRRQTGACLLAAGAADDDRLWRARRRAIASGRDIAERRPRRAHDRGHIKAPVKCTIGRRSERVQRPAVASRRLPAISVMTIELQGRLSAPPDDPTMTSTPFPGGAPRYGFAHQGFTITLIASRSFIAR